MELLKQKPDFIDDEYLTDDPDKIDYPADKAEADAAVAQEDQVRPAPLQGRRGPNDAEAIQQAGRSATRTATGMSHQFDSSELLEVYLTSLTKTFDPHSSLPGSQGPGRHAQPAASSLARRDRRLAPVRGRLCGRHEIVPGMAADKDGRLQPEDKIVGIQKEDGEEIDLVEKKLNDVVRYIRGPRGTKVRLIVQPDGTKERKIYELTRQKIELKEQHAKGKVIETKADNGKDAQDRRHQPAGLLRRYRGHARAAIPTPSAPPADCRKILERFQDKTASTPW